MAQKELYEGNDKYDAIEEGLIPINGENGNAIYGLDGNDTILGSNFRDLIDGNNGNDILIGRDGGDIILGGYGDDSLLGDSEYINATYITGNDLLFGDVGDDTLYGGPGNDKLYGGAGNDYYHYYFSIDSGMDTINDDNYATAQPGAGDSSNNDRLYVDVPITSIQIYPDGNNLVITSPTDITKGVIIEDFFLGSNNIIEYIVGPYKYYDLLRSFPTLDDPFEYNDDILNSSELSLINGKVSIEAVGHDLDYYSFSLDSGNHAVEIVTEFTDDLGNLDLGLFDSNGQILATSESLNDNEIINTNLSAGTYYVLVLPVEGISNLYTLSIESIGINSIPTLVNPIDNQIITEDESFNFTFSENTFTDADGDTLNYSATLSNSTDLPSWLSFNAITRTFSGTPTNDHVGSLEITVTATDPSSESVTDTFTITVENVNDAPTLDNPIPDQIINEDQSFNFTIEETTFNDIDVGDTLTYTAILADGSDLPSWLNFDPVTKTFSGTPSQENVGTLNLKVTATDTEGEMVEDTFILTVENSVNVFEGTPNKDLIRGTSDQDVIYGREGNDKLFGLDEDDQLLGGDGKDKLYGNGGADTLLGGLGNDFLKGNDGDDILDGGQGRDRLFGNGDDDTLLGGLDNDLLKGNDGDDILDGGQGRDRLFGNSGSDQFILRAGEGPDTIFDYKDGQDSFLLARGLNFRQLEITQHGKNTWLNLANSGELLTILHRVEAGLIGAEDFTTIA